MKSWRASAFRRGARATATPSSSSRAATAISQWSRRNRRGGARTRRRRGRGPCEIAVAARELDEGVAISRWWRGQGDLAVVAAAALVGLDGTGKVKRASLTIGGATAAPVRVADAGRMLAGQELGQGRRRDHCE